MDQTPGALHGETFNLIRDANKKVLPGEKIILKCEIPTLTVQEYEWILPGKTFKDYTANQTTGTLTQLAAGDKNQQTVRFYWADTGDNREVRCRVKINDKWFEIKNKLDVKKPTTTLTTTTGSVAVDSAWGSLELHFGSPGAPGVKFERTITLPAGFTGTTQWVQIASPLRRRQLNSGIWQKWTGSGLDTTYPYSANETTDDSPGTPLNPDYLKKTVSDTFVMYLMFKPDAHQSLWVPLRKVEWDWSGEASRSGTTWTLDSSSSSNNPGNQETSDHPVWTKNASSNAWVDE